MNALEEMGYKQDQIIQLMENHLLKIFSRDTNIKQSKTSLRELIRTGKVSFCTEALV